MHRERQVLRAASASADGAGGRNRPTAWGRGWPGLLAAFRGQSLQSSERRARGSGQRGAEAAAPVRPGAGRGGSAPHPAGQGRPGTPHPHPPGCGSPCPRQLPAPSRPGRLWFIFFPASTESQRFRCSARTFRYRPPRPPFLPSPCQHRRACRPLRALPGSAGPSSRPRGASPYTSGLELRVDSHVCIRAPPFGRAGTCETRAQIRVPSASPVSARRGARGSLDRRPPAPRPPGPPSPRPRQRPHRQAAGIGDRRPERAEPPPAPPAAAQARGCPLPPSRRPCRACSVRRRDPALPGPGSLLRVFAAAAGAPRRGAGGGETVSAPRGAPSLARGRRTAGCGPIRGRGRAGGRHALPPGLLRVISRNSVRSEERQERGAGRSGSRGASQTGRSAPGSLPPHRDEHPVGNSAGRRHPGGQPKNPRRPNSAVSCQKLETSAAPTSEGDGTLDAVENTPELDKRGWMLRALKTAGAQTPWVIDTDGMWTEGRPTCERVLWSC